MRGAFTIIYITLSSQQKIIILIPMYMQDFSKKKTSTDLICTVHIATQKNFYIIFKFHENCKGLPYIQKKIFPRVTLSINDYVGNLTENDQQLPLGYLSFTQRR